MKTALLAILIAALAAASASGQGIVFFSYGTGIRVGETLPRTELEMDMDGNGTVDFRFLGLSTFEAGFQLEPKGANKVLGLRDDGTPTTNIRARRLVVGNDISETTQVPLAWYGYRPNPLLSVTGVYLVACLDPFQCSGDFKANGSRLTTGYVGIQFFAADGLHYGWIRVQGGAENDGTILDYAYNSVPGQSIMAGAVPEPSTWALIGVGLIALWQFRRRQ